MKSVGPYEFSELDVTTTVQDGWALFDLLEQGLEPRLLQVVAPHRAAAEARLGQVLAGALSEAEALGPVWDGWRAAMTELRAAGAFGPSAVGTATGLWRSDGGVPKHSAEAIDVGWRGVAGDRQVARRHHGRPFQALCLWSTEVIAAFAADGHPLAPGLAGENVTITGLDWARVRPGVQLRLGDVLAEISSYAIPCKKNAAWFTDGRFDVMHHRHGPVSRTYATVLEPGRIAVGDPVLLEPDA